MPRPRRTNKRLAPLFNQSSGLSLVVFLFLVWLVEKARNASRICSLAQAATCYLKGYQCQNAVVHGWGMKGVTVVPSFFVVPSYPTKLRKVNDHIIHKTKSLVFSPFLLHSSYSDASPAIAYITANLVSIQGTLCSSRPLMTRSSNVLSNILSDH